MLLKHIFLLFSVFITTILANSEYEEYNTNGWNPVTNEHIYKQIKREFNQKPGYMQAEVTNDDVYLLKEEAMEIERPERNAKSVKDYLYPIVYEEVQNENHVKCKDFDASSCPEAINEEHIKENKKKDDLTINVNRPPKITRRAKELSDLNINKNYFVVEKNKPNIDNNEYTEDFIVEESLPNEEDKNAYKVTEDTDSIEAEQSKLNDKLSYLKNSPQGNIDSHNLSVTSGLSSILSKYNINAKDKLTNYALSRILKDQNPLKPSHTYQPDPFMVPHRYNSLNHMSVDPLLAVFLSHYGHYLPGVYGIRNNYNNLYGYLASNNIHNNMPFGIYKIFSDTDSSH